MSYGDASDHVILTLPFFGTDEQVRRIRVELSKSPVFQRWHALETLSKTMHAKPWDKMRELGFELAAAEAQMLALLCKLIDKEQSQ